LKNSVGIDYSMTSPAICIHSGDTWSIHNCKFFYLVKQKKYLIESGNLFGSLYPDYLTTQQRFSNLSEWVLSNISNLETPNIMIEGYSYGSVSSRLFEIGENTGLLKHSLWKQQKSFNVLAPTAIKKYATGKGNANKEKMWESFFQETQLDLFKHFGMEYGKHWNPISDIVDSYFICKLSHFG
jgi:hypothetical protein